MITKPPARLTRPSLEAHPFITVVNSILPLGFKHRTDDREWPNQEGDADFYTDNFESPGCVQAKSLAPIQAMSDTTFNQLCQIIRPAIFESVILTKEDLARCAAGNEQRFDDGTFSLNQLEGYIMAWAVLETQIRWASLADLYNESTPDQQASIHGYFVHCRNRTLSVLMDVPAPDLVIPDGLDAPQKEGMLDGQAMIYSESQQTWLRDDVFLQQYQVHSLLNATKTFFLLATASTLTQAIAKATAYTKKAKGDSVTDSIVIKYRDSYLSKADFKHTVSDKADIMEILMSPVTLVWDLEFGAKRTRATQKKLDGLSESMASASDPAILAQLQSQADELKEGISDMHLPSRNDIRRLIFSTEKALGVQWTKVAQLENDLGM